jgi:hypothetical protein
MQWNCKLYCVPLILTLRTVAITGVPEVACFVCYGDIVLWGNDKRDTVIRPKTLFFLPGSRNLARRLRTFTAQCLLVRTVAVNAHSSSSGCSLARISVSSGRRWNLFDQILILSVTYIATWFMYICLFARHEGIWGNGVTAPFILNLGAASPIPIE